MGEPVTGRTAVSWSGGKDACLAWRRTAEAGWPAHTFLTMCDADGTSKSHVLPPALLAAQAAAAGVACKAVRVPPGGYAQAFDRALAELRADGHVRVVFGDIDLQAHRDWLEPACARAGLQACFPLWGELRPALAREVIHRGIRARLVCVDTRWLDERHVGAAYDEAFLQRLPPGVCPCGEDGEFHTFVWDAPGFAAPLALRPGLPRRLRPDAPWTVAEVILQTPELA